MELFLRMLSLEHLRDSSYDELEREVTGSLMYRRFVVVRNFLF
jgi:hypothetical protein